MISITILYLFSRIGLLNLALFYFLNPLISIIVIVGELIYTWHSPYVIEILICNIIAYNVAKAIKTIILIINSRRKINE